MESFVWCRILNKCAYYLLVTLSLVIYCEGFRKQKSTCTGPRMDILTDDGVKIEPIAQSKVYIDSLSEHLEDGHTLKFEFKTYSSNSTLFYAVRRNDEFDMVSGGIFDGYLQIRTRCKSLYADLTIPKVRVDDGEWHKFKFQRKHRKGIFLLDDMEFFEQYYIGCGGFTSLNFGSTHQDHWSSQNVHALKNKYGHFEGCIRRLDVTTGIAAQPHYVAVSECHSRQITQL